MSNLTSTEPLEKQLEFDPMIVKQEEHITIKLEDPNLDYSSLTSSIDIKEEANSDTDDGLNESETFGGVYQNKHEYMQMHPNEEPFTCRLCNEKFAWESSFRAHLKIHADFPNLPSNIGIKEEINNGTENTSVRVFEHKPELNKQETEPKSETEQPNKTQDNDNFKCKVCSKVFLTAKALNVHNNRKTRGKFKCCSCNKAFPQKQFLIIHSRKHTGEKPFECKICSRRFAVKHTLITHTTIHTRTRPKLKLNRQLLEQGTQTLVVNGISTKIFKCPVCSESFPTAADLIVHNNRKMPNGQFKCCSCSKSLTTLGQFSLHIRIHTGERPYKCNICDRTFSVKCSLNRHLSSHTKDRSDSVFLQRAMEKGSVIEKVNGIDTKIFKCKVCSKVFLTASDFAVHNNRQRGKGVYVCCLCNKTCCNNTVLDIHTRGHTGEKPFECNNCNEKFRTKTNLRRHMVIHMEDRLYAQLHQQVTEHRSEALEVNEEDGRIFKCKVCLGTFSTAADLDVHNNRQIAHGVFKCCACRKRFSTNSQLIAHTGDHTEEKPFKCTLCDNKFSSKIDLNRHIHTHTRGRSVSKLHQQIMEENSVIEEVNGIETKVYKCKVCLKVFLTAADFAVHNNRQRGKGVFVCCLCNKACRNNGVLAYHTRTHTGEKPFECDTCGRKFSYNAHLRNHMVIHMEELHHEHNPEALEINKIFKCKICLEGFSTAAELDVHNNREIAGQVYKCCACNKLFYANSRFKVHIRKHTGEKPFECNICDSKYGCKSDLTRHILTHTGSKSDSKLNEPEVEKSSLIKEVNGLVTTSFKCKVCLKAFQSAADLDVHNNRRMSEAVFVCCLCGKACPNNYRLTDHMRRHTGERPFECKICGKNYTSKSALNSHMVSHIKDELHSELHQLVTEQNSEALEIKEEDNKVFKCKICSEIFQTSADLDVHNNRKIGKGAFPCCSCNRIFSGRGHLVRHHTIAHTGVTSYQCKICGKMFAVKYSLNRHIIRHKKAESKLKLQQQLLKQCSETLEIKEMDLKILECKVCAEAFSTEADLDAHNNRQVADEVFKCCACNKTFPNKSRLIKHNLSHTGEKPLKCKICDKKFALKGTLEKHLITHLIGKGQTQNYAYSKSLKL